MYSLRNNKHFAIFFLENCFNLFYKLNQIELYFTTPTSNLLEKFVRSLKGYQLLQALFLQ